MKQTTYICLLRGINVSGKNKIKMADLRQTLTTLNFQNITTYIQSGNIVFESSTTDTILLQKQIKTLIQNSFGYDVPVMVLSKTDFEAVKTDNPFYTESVDIKFLHVTLITSEPNELQINKLREKIKGEEELKVIGKKVYLYCPYGYGRTKLNNNQIERTFKTQATTRNWKTILKLCELSKES